MASRGHGLVCDPDLAACSVKAVISSNDSRFPGRAYLVFPPLRLEQATRLALRRMLQNDTIRMPAFLCSSKRDKECEIKVSANSVLVTSCETGKSFQFGFNLVYPRVTLSRS